MIWTSIPEYFPALLELAKRGRKLCEKSDGSRTEGRTESAGTSLRRAVHQRGASSPLAYRGRAYAESFYAGVGVDGDTQAGSVVRSAVTKVSCDRKKVGLAPNRVDCERLNLPRTATLDVERRFDSGTPASISLGDSGPLQTSVISYAAALPPEAKDRAVAIEEAAVIPSPKF